MFDKGVMREMYSLMALWSLHSPEQGTSNLAAIISQFLTSMLPDEQSN